MTGKSNAGFTVVEVMVTLGIIGILLAMLIPAVQYARESSRRTHCVSNLAQLGVALHSYHGAFNGLPPSVIWSPYGEPLGNGRAPIGVIDAITAGEPFTEDRMFANWVVMLMPFTEEHTTQAQLNLDLPIGHPSNEKARSTEVALMKCPTDIYNTPDNHFQRSLTQPDTGYARGNYAMNCGTNRSCLNGFPGCNDGFSFEGRDLASNNRRVWGSGIGGANNSTKFREFPNGLSKTVALEEIRAGFDPWDRRGVWSLGFVSSSATSAHGRTSHKGPNQGFDYIQGCPELRAKTGARLDAENMPCMSRKTPMPISERATARSFHAGGVTVLTADGAAHFVSDTVDPNVWHFMHRRDSTSSVELPF